MVPGNGTVSQIAMYNTVQIFYTTFRSMGNFKSFTSYGSPKWITKDSFLKQKEFKILIFREKFGWEFQKHSHLTHTSSLISKKQNKTVLK